jgi:hypothetical protein
MITGQSAPITATLAGVRMSAVGHSLPNRDVRVTSVQPSISDLMLRRRERRNGPISDIKVGAFLKAILVLDVSPNEMASRSVGSFGNTIALLVDRYVCV